MALKIKLSEKKSCYSTSDSKWYGRMQLAGSIGTEELVRLMMAHGSIFTKGTIEGVIMDLAFNIRELVLQGHPVKIDDLAIFKLGMESDGVSDPRDFIPEESIRRFTLLTHPTGVMTSTKLTKEVLANGLEISNSEI